MKKNNYYQLLLEWKKAAGRRSRKLTNFIIKLLIIDYQYGSIAIIIIKLQEKKMKTRYRGNKT